MSEILGQQHDGQQCEEQQAERDHGSMSAGRGCVRVGLKIALSRREKIVPMPDCLDEYENAVEEIGRASSRERVCQVREDHGGRSTIKKKNSNIIYHTEHKY